MQGGQQIVLGSCAMAAVIVNADDFGMRESATNRILACLQQATISSTSAMVFMDDSERAAELAREHHVDAGLHLNLTAPFSGPHVPPALLAHQERIARALLSGRYAPMLFRPLLLSSFEYAVKAQLDEYARLYGAMPHRIDGHHHMHLCANVQWQRLLPAGIILRRNFTFPAGEKGALNRFYRSMQDEALARRYRIADYFVNLQPLEEQRLRRVLKLTRDGNLEIEAHPERDEEYDFLQRGGLQALGGVTILRGYLLRDFVSSALASNADVREENLPAVSIGGAASPEKGIRLPHICVCICTYKRPLPIKRLLGDLDKQKTSGQCSPIR